MKTSSWIKIIGILCIIFGGSGIISNISEIALPNIIEMSKDKLLEISPKLLGWVIRLAYIGLVVNAIYIMAGILFLAKKSISIKFMYSALALSIFYKIVPLFFLNTYPSTLFFNYEFNISNLISPLIDVTIIAAVIMISKNYFMPADENTIRKTLTQQQLRAFSLTGVLCLSIPVSLQALWIYSSNSEVTQLARAALFKSYFPEFLHGQYSITLLSIAFCIVAIVLSSVCLQTTVKLWKAVNIIVLVLSILSLLLNLFQMM